MNVLQIQIFIIRQFFLALLPMGCPSGPYIVDSALGVWSDRCGRIRVVEILGPVNKDVINFLHDIDKINRGMLQAFIDTTLILITMSPRLADRRLRRPAFDETATQGS